MITTYLCENLKRKGLEPTGTREKRREGFMQIIEITSANDPRLAVYSTLTEAQLRNRLEPEKGIFIAESPKVIRVALQAGYLSLIHI